MTDYSSKTKDELIKILKKRDKTIKESKKYGLVWNEERIPEKVVEDCKNNLPVLELIEDRKIKTNTDTNKKYINHLLIEGDNYHSLNCLNYTHKNKIDLIYIDPPYNTGNKDFIYNDSFVNKEDSYRHSKWLNFMYKRLIAAKELLKDDGVIFISIDDNEQANLKLLCDMVFGEENFVECLIWRKKTGGSQDSINFAKEHEYILCYSKGKWRIKDKTEKRDESEFNKVINGKKAKLMKLEKWGNHSYRTDRPTLYYPIKDPNGNDFFPVAPNGQDGCWRKKPENLDKEHIYWMKNSKGRLIPYEVLYLDEYGTKDKILKQRSILYDIGATTTEAANEIKSIFGQKVFEFTKPIGLIKLLIELSCDKNSIILDFFCGSATTAQAVLELNAEDGGNRKCIVCTNNENNICENVAYPRIKKVMEKLDSDNDDVFYYLKTALIPIKLNLKNISDKEKLDFTLKANSLIQIKEDMFNDVYVKKNWYQVFTDDINSKLLSIYYKANLNEFDGMLKYIKDIVDKDISENNNKIKKLIFYIFSTNTIDKKSYDYTKNYFKDYQNIEVDIEDIPEPALEVYKLLNKIKEKDNE